MVSDMIRRLGVLVVGALTFTVVPAAPAPAASEPPAVGMHTESFVDHSRATPADVVAGITPENERRLPTTIFYPARGKPAADGDPVRDARPRSGHYPLVLFAGGSPGSPADYAPLLQTWAAAGYVVAAPEFPVSSYAGPDDVAYADLPHQSGDLRFVLRRVLALDAKKAGIPTIDGTRIAVAGHSLGGQTALSLVARCCREPRVDVALILAGVTDASNGPALHQLRGPALFVHSRNDRAVPYQPALDTCARVSGWKRMVTVEDLRGLRAHIDPYLGNSEYASIVRPATIDFLDGYLRNEEPARRHLRRAGAGTHLVGVSRCHTAAIDGR
jgi:acetyl esterase/lipase